MNLWRYECSLNTPQSDIFRHYYTYCKEWKKMYQQVFILYRQYYCPSPVHARIRGWVGFKPIRPRACYKITKIPPTHHRKKYTLGPRTWYKLYFTEPELNMYIHYSHVVFFCKVHAYRERHYDGVLYLLLKEKWNE